MRVQIMSATSPEATTLLDRLFPQGHSIRFDGLFFSGAGKCGEADVAVIGSTNHAPIGVELALRIAAETLTVIRERTGWPILLMIDTEGQRLSFRDELLGVNGYMAHLAKCIDLARRKGHRIISLVWSEAVSGGFLAAGMVADACYALPEAEIRVMNLPAMARITKQPLERLETLSRTSPVFGPGADNYFRMGAVRDVWRGDLSQRLQEALAAPLTDDDRKRTGESRGGRMLARAVAERVRRDDVR
jgi:malonate decarboxylase gamma subunit